MRPDLYFYSVFVVVPMLRISGLVADALWRVALKPVFRKGQVHELAKLVLLVKAAQEQNQFIGRDLNRKYTWLMSSASAPSRFW